LRHLSSEQFWEKMKSPGFIRLDRHHGRIGNEDYYCSIPPEDTEDFFENLFVGILSNLGVKIKKEDLIKDE